MTAAAMRKPRERGVIFTGANVLAIMAGRKTQTRHLVSTKPNTRHPNLFDGTWSDDYVLDPGNAEWRDRCMPWRVGDRLWVREAWQEFLLSEHPPGRPLGPAGRFGIPTEMAKGNVSHVAYRADGEWPDHPEMGVARWRSPLHMERRFSRLTLAVTDVRVQRLQEISEADAEAEGCDFEIWDQALAVRNYSRPDGWFCMWGGPDHYTRPDVYVDQDEIWRASYCTLWNSTHGRDAWAANPWVCALTFERLDPPTPRDGRARPEGAR